jgi:uncharacterized protein (DUF1330 family)
MPKGYWIPHLDVPDMERLQPYRTTADAWHRTNGSKLLARGGRHEVVEGRMRGRNVLREYDSYDIALAAYSSPEYTRAHALREGHAVCDFLIVEGYDGVQPASVGTPPAPAALKGYWIGHVDIPDPEAYKPYVVANKMPFGKFGARYLVAGGRHEVTEGKQRARTVVLEFPSYQAALDCYRSPDYQAAKKLRDGKAEIDLLIIEAYDPAKQ